MSPGIHHSLIDDVMDAYIAWREESAAVEAAYQLWRTGLTSEHSRTFAAYISALDREERASGAYERALRRSSLAHLRDQQRSWLRDAA